MRIRPILFPYLLCHFLQIIVWISTVKGQEPERIMPVQRGFVGKVLLGPSFLALPEVNAALNAQDYASLNESFFAMGLGFSRLNKGWIYGGELYNFMLNQSIFNNQLAVLNYHYFTARIGRVIWRNENKLLIYPEIGVGGGLANLKARPANERFPDNYWAGGPLVDIGIGGSHFTSLDASKNYYVELGFRIGYVRSFENVWILRGFTATDYRGEPISPEGLYIRVSLGMGMLK